MNNQSGRPEIGQVEPVTPFGGQITNFRNPRPPGRAVISPTNIVEGLFPENNVPNIIDLAPLRQKMLDMALHPAKKAA